MFSLTDLYLYADEKNISIYHLPMRSIKSISTPDGCIAIDVGKVEDTIEEKDCLAHELGHIMTGSFYNIYSALDIRKKHEYRADKWAFTRLVPYKSLIKAIYSGMTTIWELAEYFEVSERLMKKAITYYRNMIYSI